MRGVKNLTYTKKSSNVRGQNKIGKFGYKDVRYRGRCKTVTMLAPNHHMIILFRQRSMGFRRKNSSMVGKGRKN